MADSPPNNPEDGNIVYLWKIPVDRSYVKSLDSLLKVIAAVLTFIAFICCSAGRSDNCDDSYSSTYNYFEFVAISCFLTVLILWIFHAVTLKEKLCFKMVPWSLVGVVYLLVYILLYLIADICLAAQTCGKDSNGAAAAFGFFTVIVLGVNTFFAFKSWRGEHPARSSGSGETDAPPPYEENAKY